MVKITQRRVVGVQKVMRLVHRQTDVAANHRVQQDQSCQQCAMARVLAQRAQALANQCRHNQFFSEECMPQSKLPPRSWGKSPRPETTSIAKETHAHLPR